MFHKPSNTIRSIIVHPKEKLCCTIYHSTCDKTHHTYIVETKIPRSIRFKPTGVGDHYIATGHSGQRKSQRTGLDESKGE